MWVKICANTSLEDTLRAAELGADAVGFVFAPSSRQMRAAQVRPIADALPEAVERVGVFSSAAADEIAAAVEQAGLTTVQMHGGMNLHLARSLRGRLGPRIELIHTVHWTLGEDEASAERVAGELALLAAYGPTERVLIDTKAGTATGGTGRSFDWAKARPVLQSQPNLRVIVAGGLRPETLAAAIGVLAPWGVDVASGVEQAPGRKDLEKLRAFMENARAA